MKTQVIAGHIVTPFRIIPHGMLVVREGKIERICEPGDEVPDGESHSFPGLYLFPGLIDLHMHGALGEDSTDGDTRGLQSIRSFLLSCGVTTFLPTTMTEQTNQIINAFGAVCQVMNDSGEGARIAGLHLEGPYLSRRRKGAHNPDYLRNPDPQEVDRFFEAGGNLFARMTIAPELPGALDMIDGLTRKGVLVSLGHTEADYKTTQKACNLGARLVTHVFNAMNPLHHRQANFLSFALGSPEIAVELIADGIHVIPEIMKLVIQLKNNDNLVVVSDAVRAAGLGDGVYTLGGQEMQVTGGTARIPSTGSLAGSTTPLNQMIGNLEARFNLSLPVLSRLASLTPARLLGIDSLYGSLERGKAADIAVFDQTFHCLACFVGGSLKYHRPDPF